LYSPELGRLYAGLEKLSLKGRDGILIATIGTKPQVVTTAVDLLLRDGCSLREVVVVHHSHENSPVNAGLERLRAEFTGFPAYQLIHFMLYCISGPAVPLADIESEADAEAAFRGLYRLLLEVKRAEPTRPIHLSITGGRKVLAVYGMATAQLLFDDEDRLWYVLAGGAFWPRGDSTRSRATRRGWCGCRCCAGARSRRY
jgi:CRISPR-associated protein Csx14